LQREERAQSRDERREACQEIEEWRRIEEEEREAQIVFWAPTQKRVRLWIKLFDEITQIRIVGDGVIVRADARAEDAAHEEDVHRADGEEEDAVPLPELAERGDERLRADGRGATNAVLLQLCVQQHESLRTLMAASIERKTRAFARVERRSSAR